MKDPYETCPGCGLRHGCTNGLLNCLTRYLTRTRELLGESQRRELALKRDVEFMRDNTVRLVPGSMRRVSEK